jgi:hypothetical protein
LHDRCVSGSVKFNWDDGRCGIDQGVGRIEPENRMIVRRIISGGESGVERAALDLAIQLGIAHGGRVASGRIVDDGVLPSRYRLVEVAFSKGAASAEANLDMADGVLFISRGEMAGPAASLYRQVRDRDYPHLAIDLNANSRFQSSLLINAWLKSQKVESLFITGPRENEQPGIYRDTMECFRAAWWALMMAEPVAGHRASTDRDDLPRTLNDAVTRLMQLLPLKDRVTIANMGADEIAGLSTTLGRYIQKQFGIWEGNHHLVQSCMQSVNRSHLADEEIAALIIDHLAQELKKTHVIRVLS